MAITLGCEVKVRKTDELDVQALRERSAATGDAHPMTRQEIAHYKYEIPHPEFGGMVDFEYSEELKDEPHMIEFKAGAYTAAEIEKYVSGGKTLSLNEYGVKWRVWYGWPSDEQKAAAPWEVE